MQEGFFNSWNIAALIGLVAGVVLWTLPRMGPIGQRLSSYSAWGYAHVGFYYAAIVFALAYLMFAP